MIQQRAFITAADCFDQSQAVIEGQIARIRAASASGPPTARQAKQIARREQQLAAQVRDLERVNGRVQQGSIEHGGYSIVSAVPPAASIFCLAPAENLFARTVNLTDSAP